MAWGGHKKIGVAVTCADWRLHQRHVGLYKQIAGKLDVQGVDINALPGPDGLLLPERQRDWACVVDGVKLLVGAHKAVAIAVVAHQRCAGHPVSDDQHDHDAAVAAKALKAAAGFAGPSYALVAVYHTDDKWTLKQVGKF